MDGQQPALQHAKPKNRFTLCCFCLGGSGSDPDLSGATLDYSERCDYVVEKLTIKKVPIALFATEEDLAEMRSNAVIESSQEPVPTTTYDVNLLPKDSIVSSYYAMINHRSSEDSTNMDKNVNRVKLAKDKFTNTLSQAKKNVSVEMFIQNTNEATDTVNTLQDIEKHAKKKDEGDYKPPPLPMPVPVLKPILKQNETIKAEVHQDEHAKRYSISPELQQTLEVLGSRRPETTQSIKERMGVKTFQNLKRSPSPAVEVSTKHVTIVENESVVKQGQKPLETVTCGVSAASFPIHFSDLIKGESSSTPNESRAFVTHDGMLMEQDVQTRLTSKQLEALINGEVMGGYTNPKWKIIIKQHSKDMLSSTVSSKTTTTSESDSNEETEYEESTTE